LKLLEHSAWIVLVYGQLLGLFVFVLGAYGFGRFIIQRKWQDPQQIIHGLLQAIEMLLLVPVPVVIGAIVHELLIDMAHPEQNEISKGQTSYSIAKVFLVGIIITLTGTALLDLIVTDGGDGGSLELLLGGSALVLSLSAYVWVTQRQSK